MSRTESKRRVTLSGLAGQRVQASNFGTDLFLWDRTTGTTVLVSHATGSTTIGGNDTSIGPSFRRFDNTSIWRGACVDRRGPSVYTLALPLATRCEVTEVEVELPRDDGDATAPVLDEAWVGTEGEWLTSSSGLRYRFFSYVRP